MINQMTQLLDNSAISDNQDKSTDQKHDQGTSPKKQDFVVIRIRDNGCGMDESTKKRIFEPFYTTKRNKGTGMGLAMAYGCVENHNGWIYVTSEVDKGSEFFVFLPRVLS